MTGIAAESPVNAHFHFDLIGSLATLKEIYGREEFENWGSNNYATYLLMPPRYPIAKLRDQLPAFLDRHLGSEAHKTNKLHLQRLTDIHLRSHLDSEIEANSDIVYIYILTAIGIFILLIACVNFMNLATARSSLRAREVGLRKVVGADRGQLIRQFMGESILLAFLAMAVAVGLALLARPALSAFTARNLSLDVLRSPWLLAALCGIALVVGLVAGSYPAVVLSAMRPATILKGSKGASSHGAAFRTVLVVFQFAISISLIVCVGVVGKQLRYTRDRRLGFDKDRIVVLSMDESMNSRYDAIRQELLAYPGIVNAAASRRVPSGRLLDSSDAQVLSGSTSRPVDFRIAMVPVDFAFIDTYRMEMAAGRDFSREHPSDVKEAFILNETAVRKLGWTPAQAVGKPFAYGFNNRKGMIVGVVKDFNFESLHQPISPLVFFRHARGLSPSLGSHPARCYSRDPGSSQNALRGVAPRLPVPIFLCGRALRPTLRVGAETRKDFPRILSPRDLRCLSRPLRTGFLFRRETDQRDRHPQGHGGHRSRPGSYDVTRLHEVGPGGERYRLADFLLRYAPVAAGIRVPGQSGLGVVSYGGPRCVPHCAPDGELPGG